MADEYFKLSLEEEKLLRRIARLGPDHVYAEFWPNIETNGAFAALLRYDLIAFNADVDELAAAMAVGRRRDMKDRPVRFVLTEAGEEQLRALAAWPRRWKPLAVKLLIIFMILTLVGIAGWLR